jgi:hypothetical protein
MNKGFLDSGGFTLVGNFTKTNRNKNLIGFEWTIDNDLKKDDRGRIYIFYLNNKTVLKIGKSLGKTGIVGTLSNYFNALSGQAGPNRYALHIMISKLLENPDNKIEVYVRWAEQVEAQVRGFEGYITQKVSLDVSIDEATLIAEYVKLIGSFPEWNFIESNTSYPQYIQEGYNRFRDSNI